MIKIRRAEHGDAPWVCEQLKQFDQFVGTKRRVYESDEVAMPIVLSLIDHHVVLVAEREGELLGMIAGIITPHFLNPHITVLSEVFWWVEARSRFSRAGVMLLNAFNEIGEKSADWVLMTLTAYSPVKDEHLSKRGYKMTEKSFIREIN